MSTKKKTDDARADRMLAMIAGELHAIFKRGTADVIQVGRLLLQAKMKLGHGRFLPWLKKEFSLSDKSAERYMAAHKFMTNVAAPLRKFDKMSNLKLRPSAIYELDEMHSRGTVTEADVVTILNEAAKNWVGSERLREILKSCRPDEAAPETTGGAEPEVTAAAEITGEAMTGEATDAAASTEPAGEETGEAGDGAGKQPTEMPPDNPPPSAKDERNLASFAASILTLKRLATGSLEKYVATDVETADLETVANFVRAVADLKKKQSAETGISADSSAEARKTHYAEAEAA
jgi:hypothetical protein